MSFVLTNCQARAWAAIQELAKLPRTDRAQTLIVSGYAGTGKTTLMKHAPEFFRECTICTPTGKAALRVAEATGLEATTFHRWLYNAETDRRTGKPVFTPKDAPSVPRQRVLVIDEGSMVSEEDWEEIHTACSTVGMNIVVLGDPFQLPPVAQRANSEPFSLLSPQFAFAWKRIEMTEIRRSALDNPLVRASMLLRRGTALDVCDAMMLLERLPKDKPVPEAVAEILAKGGTAICHTNKTRNALNRAVRPLVLGRDFNQDTIHGGEPLMVTYNNYDVDYFNGEIVPFEAWKTAPTSQVFDVLDTYTGKKSYVHFGRGTVGGRDVVLGVEEILGLGTQGVGFKAYAKKAERSYDGSLPYLNANLGYALTCHKSQGSEWPEVLVVFEDSMNAGKLGHSHDARRWMYTAVTRAREKTSYTGIWTPPEGT